MNTSIFVPKKLCVGYCNRKDTYTGKLAYVIYYDAQGKLRKETSWQNWRDNTIEPQEFDNEPTEGFVINKKVGGVGYYNVRQTYARVYDPRGFEFEITIPNLLWILENCDCIKGKGLVGQFVYGWDNKDLVLVPVDSPDYKEIQEKADIAFDNGFIKANQLIIGATYEKMNGQRFVYMGKAPHWTIEFNHEQQSDGWFWNRRYLGTYEKPVNDPNKWYNADHFRLGYNLHRLERNVKGKDRFWFINLGESRSEYLKGHDYAESMSSVSKKFIKCVSTNTEEYERYLSILKSDSSYCPIDYENSGIRKLSFEDFRHLYSKSVEQEVGKSFHAYNGEERPDSYSFYYKNGQWHIDRTEYSNVTYENLEKIYTELVPVYGEEILMNGSISRRYGYYV